MFLVLVAVLSITAQQALGAERGPSATGETATVREVSATASAPSADPVDGLLDDLAQVEDPALEDHVAAGSLTAGELALVIVFLILLFPVGIILLIVFLLDDD